MPAGKSPYSGFSDRQLLKLYRSENDLRVIGELYHRYLHLVYGVCMKYLKDQEGSKDASMEIFEKLVESLKKQEVENFTGWLYVTSRNHCLMQLRKKKDFVDINNHAFMENEVVMHHDTEDPLEDDLAGLEEGISSLSDNQRQCITMFYLEKKSYKEIEKATGYSFKEIKSFLQNGRRNLKLFFDQKR